MVSPANPEILWIPLKIKLWLGLTSFPHFVYKSSAPNKPWALLPSYCFDFVWAFPTFQNALTLISSF